VSEPFHYDEWDYQVQLSRPEWTTVIERRQRREDPALMDQILEKHKPIASRIRHLIDALQPQGIVRKRGYEDGDELDIDAAVRAMIDIRRGIMPDPRVNIRITRHLRDLSMIVLMDLSASTNDRIGDLKEDDEGYLEQPSILDLTREATGLLSAPRRAVLPLQGFRRILQRRQQGQAGRYERRSVDAHGCGTAARRLPPRPAGQPQAPGFADYRR
jgi:hypothetical protein